MADNRPRRISFPEIRSIIQQLGGSKEPLPFVRHGIGILHPANTLLTRILKEGTPYIIEETRLGIVRRGRGRVTINMIDHTVCANTLIFLGRGTIVQPQQMSPDIEICALMVSEERIVASGRDGGGAATPIALPSYLVVEATEEETTHADAFFALIASLLHATPCPDSTLNTLMQALTHYYIYLARQRERGTAAVATHGRVLFNRFITLLNQHCKEQHTLAFYADRLCVTPRYLGVVVKMSSGVTAKEWIDRAVTTSAKVLLRHSNKQVQQIADDLHFPNTSFFCKFFRRMTGLSPQAYRDS